MKRIVYLTFYFEPDLCAGSFRNTPLAGTLARLGANQGVQVDVYTTMPNRYRSWQQDAPACEERGNLTIHRIPLPAHQSGMVDQMRAFWAYERAARRQVGRAGKPDLVFASSSRLFTAWLGYRLARKWGVPLYLDIRDIFVETMEDVLSSGFIKSLVLPVLRRIEAKTFRYATHINVVSEGFQSYFEKYPDATYTVFPNGIDPGFLDHSAHQDRTKETGSPLVTVYAGNIGQGQGLHRIIPETAHRLGDGYEFWIIGDGGARALLEAEVHRLKLSNVIIRDPVDRSQLVSIYRDADVLFLHLNDFAAFRRVLPSKIFELATVDRPILAGVSGYAAEFLRREVPGSMVFEPCDADALTDLLRKIPGTPVPNRSGFLQKYSRSRIDNDMAQSILRVL